MDKNPKKELQILQNIVTAISALDKDTQVRILQSVVTFLDIESMGVDVKAMHSSFPIDGFEFSQREQMNPKEFLLEKEPRTAVARIACLAFYLTHYRDISHFKTLDLSKLNTEAAQQKFSNPAQTVNDAAKVGLLVPASRGQKQLSSMGEQYVQALPDKEATKKVLNRMRWGRARKSSSKTKLSTFKKTRVEK